MAKSGWELFEKLKACQASQGFICINCLLGKEEKCPGAEALAIGKDVDLPPIEYLESLMSQETKLALHA